MNMRNVKSSILLLMLLGIVVSVAVQISSVQAQAQGGDFVVTVSPPRATIGTDGIARYSIRVTSINGFSGTVTLSVSGIPSVTDFQASYSFQPTTLVLAPNLDAYSVLTVSISTTSGYYYPYYNTGYQQYPYYYGYYYYPYGATFSFNVVGVSGSITKTVPVNVDVLAYASDSLDVSVSLNPSSILLPGGISQSTTNQLTLTVTARNLRSGDVMSVTPQLYDVPTGLSASFNPQSAQMSSGGAPVTFSASLLMTPEFLVKSGTYQFAVVVTAFIPTYYSSYNVAGLFKVAILTIVVPPYLTISANPSILNVYIGGTDQKMQIVVNTLSRGIVPPISLSVQGVPPGVVANLQNDVVTPSGGQPATTDLVFNAPSTLPSGIYPITISATTFGITKYTNASIYVRPQGDYSLTTSELLVNMTPSGSTHAVTVTVQPQGGFRATIQLSVTQLPPGVTASLSTNTITVQSDSPIQIVVTFVVSTKAVPGTYSVSVVAGTGIAQRTTNITLVVRSGASEIWPVVFLVVVLVGVASAISFLAIPRGKHVHIVRQD